LGGELGDSRVEIRYRVLDLSGKEQLIRYRPEGKSTITFQQIELKSGGDAEACAALMDGRRGPEQKPRGYGGYIPASREKVTR
jgi:hypothetical protein